MCVFSSWVQLNHTTLELNEYELASLTGLITFDVAPTAGEGLYANSLVLGIANRASSVHEQTVLRWRTGDRAPDGVSSVEFASLFGLDLNDPSGASQTIYLNTTNQLSFGHGHYDFVADQTINAYILSQVVGYNYTFILYPNGSSPYPYAPYPYNIGYYTYIPYESQQRTDVLDDLITLEGAGSYGLTEETHQG